MFKLKGLPLRILKLLYTNKDFGQLRFTDIDNSLRLKESREQYEDSVELLLKEDFIERDDGKIWISSNGEKYITEFDKFDLAEVFKFGIDSAIIKFLYLMNEPVNSDSFPKSITTHLNVKGKGMGDDYRIRGHIQSDETLSKYIDIIDHVYLKLNVFGKSYYETLKKKLIQEENIQSLQLEKLVGEVAKLRQDFSDYPQIRRRSKNAIKLSFATIVVTVVLQIIEWKCNTPS